MKIEEIQDIFFQECSEALVQAEEGLLALQSGTHDGETINTIFRAIHSIKGGSGAFGFKQLQHFTHHFETLLDQVRSGDHAITPSLVAVLLSGFDMLSDHIGAVSGGGDMPDDGEILKRLQDVVSGVAQAGEAPAEPEPEPVVQADDLGFDLAGLIGAIDDGVAPVASWEKEDDAAADVTPAADAEVTRLFFRPLRGAMAHGGEPLLLLRELVDLGGAVSAIDSSAIPALDDFDPEECYVGWHVELPASVARTAIEEVFEFVENDCVLNYGDVPAAAQPEVTPAPAPAVPAATPAPAAAAVEPDLAAAGIAETPSAPVVDSAAPSAGEKSAAAPAPVGVTQTIRVDLEKLDRLVNLVGELVITQSMLAQRLLNCGFAQINELSDLDHLTRELQDSAMAIRAQPIRSVFSRVPRIVRELQESTGKRVRLEVEGEATELDKTVVERIGEPLTHLIRNAIDHGLESPEQRIAAGKDPEGRVRLSAEHRSGRILISVSDDGHGIDRERVFAKAVERGLISADARLTDEEIDNLIFAAGFSTAQTVSNISGRGVGMDVVRRNVQALGGRISISSRPGEGSTFTMSLPLTLAILDGMIVSVGEQTYVVPLTHIIESLRPAAEDVRTMGRNQPMLNVRGTWLPVQPVAKALGVPGAESDPCEAVLIVVESEATGQAVLMVDEIRDQRQVVIKSLETNYRQIEGVAGATILGDGRVALILDVEAITSTPRTGIDHGGGRVASEARG